MVKKLWKRREGKIALMYASVSRSWLPFWEA